MNLLFPYRFVTLFLPLAILIGCGSPPDEKVLPLAEWKGGAIDRAMFEKIRSELNPPSSRPADPLKLQPWRRAILEDYVINQETENWNSSESAPMEGEVFQPTPHETALVEIMRQQLFHLAPISQKEIDAYYEDHPSEFGHPEQIRLHHIFLRYPLSPTPKEKEAVGAKMETLLEQLRQGANFEDLARTHSQSETAPKGGLIGNMARGKMASSLETILWNLEKGEPSELVPTPQGVHLFMVTLKIPKLEVSLEEARGGIRRNLEKQAVQQEVERLFGELLQDSESDYYPEALEKDPSSILFQLAGRRITQEALVRWVQEKEFKDQRALSPLEHLKDAVFKELLLWKARKANVEEDPELASRFEDLNRSNQTAAAIRQLLNRELDGVPNGEIQEFYNQNKKRFQSPKLYRIRLLTLPFPHDGNPNATFDALRRLSESIANQEIEFAQAARDQSADISAYRDGDLGWIRLDTFGEWAGPQGKKTVESLKVGELSVPFLVEVYDPDRRENIRTAFALTRIEEIKNSAPKPLEEVRREVVRQWLQVEGETLDHWFREHLLERVQFVFNEKS